MLNLNTPTEENIRLGPLRRSDVICGDLVKILTRGPGFSRLVKASEAKGMSEAEIAW